MKDDEREYDDRHYRDGRPGLRMIWPLLIGIILIILGVSYILGINLTTYFWAVVAIIVGLLIIMGAILRSRRY